MIVCAKFRGRVCNGATGCQAPCSRNATGDGALWQRHRGVDLFDCSETPLHRCFRLRKINTAAFNPLDCTLLWIETLARRNIQLIHIHSTDKVRPLIVCKQWSYNWRLVQPRLLARSYGMYNFPPKSCNLPTIETDSQTDSPFMNLNINAN